LHLKFVKPYYCETDEYLFAADLACRNLASHYPPHLPALADYSQELVLMVFPYSPDCYLPADYFDDFDPKAGQTQDSAKRVYYYSVGYMEDFVSPVTHFLPTIMRVDLDLWLMVAL